MVSMSGEGPDHTLILRPNLSLSWRQAKVFLVVVALVLASLASGFAAAGLWPVLPLAGAEWLALATALYLVQRRGHRTEVVSVRGGRVAVEKGSGPSRAARWDFPRRMGAGTPAAPPGSRASVPVGAHDARGRGRAGRFPGRRRTAAGGRAPAPDAGAALSGRRPRPLSGGFDGCEAARRSDRTGRRRHGDAPGSRSVTEVNGEPMALDRRLCRGWVHGVSRAAAGLAALLPLGAAHAAWELNMPRGVTLISREAYDQHMLMLWWCVGIGVVVFGAMFYSMIRHRRAARPHRGELPPQHLRRDRVDGHSGGHSRPDGDSRYTGAHRDGGHVGIRHDPEGDRPPVEVALRVPRGRRRLLQLARAREPRGDLLGRVFARALSARGRQRGGPSGWPEGPDPAHRERRHPCVVGTPRSV